MPEEKRTQFAMAALGFADLFKVQIGSYKLPGPVPYTVELAAPEGPSTGGGKQGVLHIKLTPEVGGPVTVAGWANPFERTAELRPFDHLAQAHAMRFHGQQIPLDRPQYDALFARMHQFLAEQGLQVSVVAGPPRPSGAMPAQAAPSSSSIGLIIAILAIVAVILGIGVFLFLRSRGG
ncbi:MAG: hypothetical protein HY906_20360 [Deltaproteobacteria bacterium]|nr:hypothetical protein [Deltaproteobacteria bacterium]